MLKPVDGFRYLPPEQPRDWITEPVAHLAVDDRLWALLYMTFVRGWNDTRKNI